MPKQQLALEPGGTKRLEISWHSSIMPILIEFQIAMTNNPKDSCSYCTLFVQELIVSTTKDGHLAVSNVLQTTEE